MRHARRKIQRIVRLAAVGGLLCGGLMVSNAMAGESTGRGGAAQAADPAAELVSQLGTSRTAGSWIGADGRRVVAVTDKEAADEVRAAGADAKVVRNSMDRLRAATETLRTAPRVPGTAWAMDYASNEIMVRADSTVSSGDWSRMTGIAEEIGGFVRMERTPGAFTTRVNGAEPIFGEGRRCSAGFNVTDGRDTFILTAGHCGPEGTAWFQDGAGSELVGTTTTTSFPGSDFSLVRYESTETVDKTNVVGIGNGRGVRIVGVADPVVGQQVFRNGSTTGFRSGEVTAVNATVNYPEGTVTGLIETTVCAESGDSGGPLFSQGLAMGVTSGGDGDCDSGGTTYFQPVTKVLQDLGMNLSGVAAPPSASGTGNAAAPPVATGSDAAGAPDGSGFPGRDVSQRVTSIVDFDSPGLGLGVLGLSLVGLVGARWIVSAQERREFRSFYSASWG